MRSLAAAIAASLLLCAAPSFADATDKAMASSLFKKGRELAKAGNAKEACDAFEASDKLDPGAPGTTLNLAICHEQLEKWAAAWEEYTKALAQAKKSNNAERLALATDGLARLEKVLSKVIVTVSPANDAASIAVTLDGRAIARGGWGVELPVDPGAHEIAAMSPGHRKWSMPVTIGKTATTQTIEVPALEVETAAPVAQPPPPATSVEAKNPASTSVDRLQPEGRNRGTSSARWGAYVTGGFGIAALGFGGYAWLHARSVSSDANALFDSRKDPGVDRAMTTAEANDEQSRARTWNTIGIVSMGVGVAAIGVSTYILLTARDDRPATSVSLVRTDGGWSMSLAGAF